MSTYRLNVRLFNDAHYKQPASWRAAEYERQSAECMRIPRDPVPLPARIIITRIAPRALLSLDSLVASAHRLRHFIAARFDLDADDARLVWRYLQAGEGPHEYAAMVDILHIDE